MKSARRTAKSRARKLTQSFFGRPADEVARELIGKILVRRAGEKLFRARVVETEAYLGPDDLASHASKGRTERTEVLFGTPGRAYVYLIYGMYEMLNVVAGTAGQGQGVLFRAAAPLDDWKANLSGPGRLTRGMQITRLQNGLNLTGAQLYLLDDPDYQPTVETTKRIGIDYARHWKDAPLRFVDVTRRVNTPAKRAASDRRSRTPGRSR